jgi:hypothetical protein
MDDLLRNLSSGVSLERVEVLFSFMLTLSLHNGNDGVEDQSNFRCSKVLTCQHKHCEITYSNWL